MNAEPLYRIVSVLLVDGDGRVLLRHGDVADPVAPRQWSFPGGEVAAGETPEAAARRLVVGETALTVTHPLVLFGQHILPRPAPWSDIIQWFGLCAAADVREEDMARVGGRGAAFVAPEDTPALDLYAPFVPLLRAFLASPEYAECRVRAARTAGGAA